MKGPKVCRTKIIPAISTKNIFVGRRLNQLKAVTVCSPAKESDPKSVEPTTESSTTSTDSSSITPIETRTTTENSSLEPITTTSTPISSKICTVEFVPVIVPSYHSISGIKMYFPVKACSGKNYPLVSGISRPLKQGKTHHIPQDIETSAKIIDTIDMHHFLRI